MSLQLLPGSDPEKQSCQARLEGEMLPCWGSGIFSFGPTIIPLKALNATNKFGPNY